MATPTTGLVSYWTMDDLADSQGSSNLTNSGATSVTGLLNDAWDFDGASDFMTATPTFPTGSFSISMWVNFDTVAAFEKMSGIDKSESGSQGMFALEFDNNSKFQFTVTNTLNSTTSRFYDTLPTASTWYHLVGVYDDTLKTVRLYVNNVNAGSASFTGTRATASGSLHLGVGFFNGLSGNFDGDLDEVALYNAILTDADVNDLYGGGTPPGAPGSPSGWSDNFLGIDNSTIAKINGVPLENISKINGQGTVGGGDFSPDPTPDPTPDPLPDPVLGGHVALYGDMQVFNVDSSIEFEDFIAFANTQSYDFGFGCGDLIDDGNKADVQLPMFYAIDGEATFERLYVKGNHEMGVTDWDGNDMITQVVGDTLFVLFNSYSEYVYHGSWTAEQASYLDTLLGAQAGNYSFVALISHHGIFDDWGLNTLMSDVIDSHSASYTKIMHFRGHNHYYDVHTLNGTDYVTVPIMDGGMIEYDANTGVYTLVTPLW